MRATMFVVIVLQVLVLATASAARNPRAGKKLIEYGWDCPDTAFVKANVEKMEQVPFDGVVIRAVTYRTPNGGPEALGWKTFSKYRIQPADYEHAIADLKATRFTRLTDNFIQVIAYPGDVDFFDRDWDIAAHNAACLARIAKQGGCVGVMFDPEMYGKFQTWSYEGRPQEQKNAHTYEEYCARVRECGRTFMRAINREFPDIKILTLYGHCLPYVEAALQTGGKGLQYANYALLPAFYDGMLDVATPETVFIDGHEFSYGYGYRKQYMEARKRVLREARTISKCPDEFTQFVRVGFGVWSDWDAHNFGWDPKDFSKNYWTPGALRTALAHALALTDEYVWVYAEELRWWDFNAPPEYVEVLALAKTGPGPEEGGRPGKPKPVTAASQQGYSDADTFGEYKSLAEMLDLPKDGWRFAQDGKDEGQAQGWHKPDFDDSKWRVISIGKFWDEQNETCIGVGWYRLRFRAPALAPGKTALLVFGAVDESAWVWLNGESVGSHAHGGAGWMRAFALDVTKAIRPDAENVLAVRVLNRIAVGGIWKSVKLFVK